MLRLKNLDKEVYDNYVKSHKDESHFLHSESLTEFIKVTKKLNPYYLGLVSENDEIVSATSVFQEPLAMNYCCLYIPAGFIMDYKNKYLLKTMTNSIINFANNKKAISIKIAPYINDNLKEEDVITIKRNLREQGFKQANDSLKIMLPSEIARLDLSQDMEDIENNFSETIKEYLAKAIKLETEVAIGSKKDLPNLYKDHIVDQNTIETLYEILNGNVNTKATIIIGKINLTKTINSIEKNIKKTNGKEVIIYRGNVIPLVRLNERLDIQADESEKKYVIIVNVGDKTVGLLVDSLLGQQEIVIKPLGKTLKSLKEYIGATILGNGLVTLILDVGALL